MRKAENRLAEEAHRVTLYLSNSTEAKLKHLSETELITTHARTLVEMDGSGSICLMRDDKVDDLKRMYILFSRVPSTLDVLRGTCTCRCTYDTVYLNQIFHRSRAATSCDACRAFHHLILLMIS
jgi:Cullin family